MVVVVVVVLLLLLPPSSLVNTRPRYEMPSDCLPPCDVGAGRFVQRRSYAENGFCMRPEGAHGYKQLMLTNEGRCIRHHRGKVAIDVERCS